MAEITLLKDIANAIRQSSASGTEAYDTSAIVVRTEGSTAWVHIPGGVDETPVEMSINASAGDTVRVRVSGGQAWLIGNNTAPPTDDRRAKEAATSAERAQSTANQAVKNAEDAARAAEDAQNSADNARISANNARVDAGRANTAANNALTQLSVVEDVVGVLTWISEHGSYAISVDTEVVEGKFYFTREGSGTEADPYHYNLVISPSGDPSALGYYELTGIDEAVTNYIAAHLALTDAGLWVTKDNSGYKILVASSAVSIYDPNGELVVTYGASIRFSSSKPQYIGGENAYIIFYDKDGDGIPESIDIGGNNVFIGGSRTLSSIIGAVDNSITQVEIQYAKSDSSSIPPGDGEWSTASPLWEPDKYIWQRTVTTKNGQQTISNVACIQGAVGSNTLRITTAPSSYKTQVDDFKPTYRIARATVESQSGLTPRRGDIIEQSYYHYVVGLVKDDYVYLGARSSIRGAAGAAGADAVTLRIDSSRGVLFKNNVFSTVLTVTIQKGDQNITDSAAMQSVFGSGAYLQWYWRKFDDDDWGIMSVSDSHISDGGFTLTVTPDDVDEKIVFKCDLEI